jgi:hypothetical protein
VVTGSVAPLTMVQGNPARPVARCGIPLKSGKRAVREFYRRLQPMGARPKPEAAAGSGEVGR